MTNRIPLKQNICTCFSVVLHVTRLLSLPHSHPHGTYSFPCSGCQFPSQPPHYVASSLNLHSPCFHIDVLLTLSKLSHSKPDHPSTVIPSSICSSPGSQDRLHHSPPRALSFLHLGANSVLHALLTWCKPYYHCALILCSPCGFKNKYFRREGK